MTREEAREYFEHHMRFYCVTGVCREAEEMAVEEFKKEPCEDAISRQASKEAVKRASASGTVQMLLMEILDGMPSVNPMPCEDSISRQEAIDAFSMFAEYESNRTNAEWVDRIRVVLSSLPSVTPNQVLCEDAISREAVLDILARYEDAEELAGVLIRVIKQLPFVTPNQRTGHWIDTGWKFQTDTDEILYGYGCSECGGISFFRKYDNKILGGKWCHCCGARMVEPQESGDKG